jgi:tetratricopeptide (TPR) repeat protein/NAD-dependent dihydropyrimidine dehydrogenase PreA subunit
VSSCTTQEREKVPGTAIARSRASRARALVLVLVHLAIAAHIAHWYWTGETMTPLEPSEAMEFSKHSVINAGFVFFLAATLLTAIFGRFFCGWACHIVALQDLCRWMLLKVGITPKPLRSRALLFVPSIAFIYMFLWPLAYRLWIGEDISTRSTEWTTSSFWETFPPWPIAALTFATCGFAVVYFLGSKGFCTYACPYGALFGLVDKVAPGRIRVTDACEGCGHCTATCTSNVNVAAEVRDYGQVVDSGCMKCLDCVSVCPKDALYFGFGKVAKAPRSDRPAHAKGDPIARGKLSRWGSLIFKEELLMVLLFTLGLFTFRGLYEAVPFLFALGLAAILASIGLLAVRMITKTEVRLQSTTLKTGGAVTAGGHTFLGGCLLLGLFWAHSAAVQVHERRAELAFIETESLRRAWAPNRTPSLNAADKATLARLSEATSFLDEWSLIPSVHNAQRLSWARLLLGDEEGYIAALRQAIELAPTRIDSRADLSDFLIYAKGDIEGAEAVLREGLGVVDGEGDLHVLILSLGSKDARRLAIKALSSGDNEGYILEMRRAIELSPRPLDSYRELSEFLLSTMRDPGRAEELLLQGLASLNEEPTLLYLFGVLKALSNEPEEAVKLFQRSLAADPSSLQARENLAGMLCQLGRLEEGAAQYREALSQREDAGTHLLLAQALLALENPSEALSHAKRAAELLPDDPFPREVAAECERRLSAGPEANQGR